MSETVIGVDGCPGGWIAVIWNKGKAESKFFALGDFGKILKEDADMIAVDMPIGFPDRHGRNADQEARGVLSPFGSRVFSVPCRDAVYAANWTEAIRINKLNSNGVSVTPVTNAIRPRMQEVDSIMSPSLEFRVREIHPEVTFFELNKRRPLAEKKKTREGELRRQELLRDAGFPILDLDAQPYRKSLVARDDIVDACAAAVSALRIVQGLDIHYPVEEVRDRKGLLMRIHA
jgi:predicted RNase H-like nuclease